MKRLFLYILLSVVFYSLAFSQSIAIKTNLPYLATTTPNLGFEFAMSNKTTFELIGGLNPFTISENKYNKHWLAHAEFRYWTCDKFNGHFFGLHALGGQFNVGGWDIPVWHLKKLKDVRYQGFAYGAGISYGYQWLLNKRWNLEVTLGGGYARLDYDKYPCTKCGTKIDTDKKDYWGPTKGAISLIYIIK